MACLFGSIGTSRDLTFAETHHKFTGRFSNSSKMERANDVLKKLNSCDSVWRHEYNPMRGEYQWILDRRKLNKIIMRNIDDPMYSHKWREGLSSGKRQFLDDMFGNGTYAEFYKKGKMSPADAAYWESIKKPAVKKTPTKKAAVIGRLNATPDKIGIPFDPVKGTSLLTQLQNHFDEWINEAAVINITPGSGLTVTTW